MTGAADWALETFAPPCWRCGGLGADSFEDRAALEAHLAAVTRPSLAGQAAMMPSFGVRAVQPADLEPGKPVHARCRPGGLGELLRTIGF